MSELKELLREALDYYDNASVTYAAWATKARAVLTLSLAEPAPEPVAWMMYDESKRIPLVCHLEPSNRHLVDAFPVYRAPLPANPSEKK